MSTQGSSDEFVDLVAEEEGRRGRGASSSLAGPSTGTLHAHLSSYPGAGYHTDGGVPFAAPTVHQDTGMLQSSSTPEEDDDGHYNVTDRYY